MSELQNDTAPVGTYKGFNASALESAFRQVCNPQDWKAPILCNVLGEQVALVCAAIEFFTATTPRVSMRETPGRLGYVIESEGYRMGPAGDH